MEIVLSALRLDGPGGMQTYLLAVAPHLERLGHQVTIFSPELGAMADVARARGLRVTQWEHELPTACDAIIAQDAITLLMLADRYPAAVRLIVVHSAEYDVHLPPPSDLAVAVVLNDAVERRVRAMAGQREVIRLRQPIDKDRYHLGGGLPERPRTVLMLGNYLQGREKQALVEVCERAGLAWRQVGLHGELLVDPIPAIGEVEVVIGQGRSVLDAMSCGRAVWVYGPIAGDGWVTGASYRALEADGFRGRATDALHDAGTFASALADYDPGMGTDNRKLVTMHHSAYQHACELVELLLRAPIPERRVDLPLRELARAIRTQFDAQASLESLGKELRQTRQGFYAQQAQLASVTDEREISEGQRDQLVESVAHLRAEVERISGELARAEEGRQRMENSRRWRLSSRILRPVEVVRRRLSPP